MKSLHQFDLNLLLILDALITHCHVSRAAQHVHLSQSAMSHALNRLRTQLDDPILVRCGQGLEPSPRATEMLPQVRNIITLLEQTLAPKALFSPTTSQHHFTIACTDYFEIEYFPKLIAHCQIIAPNVVIEIEMINEHTINERLENKAVDLVIGIDSSQSLPSHLVKQHWRSQPLMCLISTNNTQVEEKLSLAQYCAHKHITFLDATDNASSIVDRWLSQQNTSRQHIARVVNYVAAARAVMMTQALMTLPQDMATLFCRLFEVKQILPPDDMPSVEMSMVNHPLFSNDPPLMWLIEQIKQLDSQTL